MIRFRTEGLLHRVFGRTLDVLYPCRCALCETSLDRGRSLCGNCADQLPRIAAPFCATCGEMFSGGAEDRPFACPHCSNLKFRFSFARAALARDSRALDLIHRLKYQRELHLAPELGQLACEAFADPRLQIALAEHWPLVPVPLHPSRWRNRQFNQAAEISRVISRNFDLPVVSLLHRSRATETQTHLSRRERMKNLKDAFSLANRARKSLSSTPSGALLVDDVFTTGSTVNECARVLHKAGIKQIAVVTVMRG